MWCTLKSIFVLPLENTGDASKGNTKREEPEAAQMKEENVIFYSKLLGCSERTSTAASRAELGNPVAANWNIRDEAKMTVPYAKQGILCYSRGLHVNA